MSAMAYHQGSCVKGRLGYESERDKTNMGQAGENKVVVACLFHRTFLYLALAPRLGLTLGPFQLWVGSKGE